MKTGYRIGGRNLNTDEQLLYLSERSATNVLFLYRLYQLLKESEVSGATGAFNSKVVSAFRAGDIEAAYTICKYASDFSDQVSSQANEFCKSYISTFSEPLAYSKLSPRLNSELRQLASLPQLPLNGKEAEEYQMFIDYASLRSRTPWQEASSSSCLLSPKLNDLETIPPMRPDELLIRMSLDLRSTPVWCFDYGPIQDAPRVRILDTVALMDCIGTSALRQAKNSADLRALPTYAIEAGDLPTNEAHIYSFERALMNSEVALIPDVYFFNTFGYRKTKKVEFPSWEARKTSVIWRGSTTGFPQLTEENVAQLPRVRLALMGLADPDLLDFGITSICQARDGDISLKIDDMLDNMGIKRNFVAPYSMGNYKFIIDIDGNSNSWGFFEKLIFGSCILKVDSPFEQWFYKDIEPWTHFIPVNADLSNLSEIVEWCLRHDAAAEEIAINGRNFALNLNFQSELDRVARNLLQDAGVPINNKGLPKHLV